MDSNTTFRDFIRENKALLREYVDLRVRLFKLQAVKILSRSLGMLILIWVAGSVILFSIFFLGLAFSAWIAEQTQSAALGHLAAASLFLVLFILCILFRRTLFLNPLIRLFIEENTDDLDGKNI